MKEKRKHKEMLSAIFSLDVLYWILLVLYIPACLGLIVIVLLQKGKGTGFAGAFGVGAGSETVFGPRARRSLPVRMTYVAAAAFMLIALVMSMISGRVGKGAAPTLAEVTEIETATGSSALSDLNIGTGVQGAAKEAPEAEESEGAETPLAPEETSTESAKAEEEAGDSPATAESEEKPAETGTEEASETPPSAS